MGYLIGVLGEKKDEDLLAALDEALRALLGSIGDPERFAATSWMGRSVLMVRSFLTCDHFSIFCEESDLDSSLYYCVDCMRQLISLVDDLEFSVHVGVESVWFLRQVSAQG